MLKLQDTTTGIDQRRIMAEMILALYWYYTVNGEKFCSRTVLSSNVFVGNCNDITIYSALRFYTDVVY